MSQIEDYNNRQLIPRWRMKEEATERGELSPLSVSKEGPFTEESIRSRLADWRRNPTSLVAADLVGTAFSLGLDSLVADAAQFLLSNKSNIGLIGRSIATLSLRTLGIDAVPADGNNDHSLVPFPDAGQSFDPAFRSLTRNIHFTKQRLSAFPQNPFLWSNLSYYYVLMGQLPHAERSMKSALFLARDNRYIVRAASRLLLHQGDKQAAHELVIRTKNLLSDPWLLSAEIALSAIRSKSSKFIRTARKLLDSEQHSPFHMSELASGLGTLETRAGNRRGGNKLIFRSLKNPSENSIAQAAWIARHHHTFQVPMSDLEHSAEAKAWACSNSGDWDTAEIEARKWQLDQPYSSNPAILASNIANMVKENYEKSIEYLEEGKRSNPFAFGILNNLAVAYAQKWELEKAYKVFSRINLEKLTEDKMVVYMATSGLLALRSGIIVSGMEFYRVAIEKARHLRPSLEILARLHLSFEMLRLDLPNAEETRNKALDDASVSNDPWCIAVARRLRLYRRK